MQSTSSLVNCSNCTCMHFIHNKIQHGNRLKALAVDSLSRWVLKNKLMESSITQTKVSTADLYRNISPQPLKNPLKTNFLNTVLHLMEALIKLTNMSRNLVSSNLAIFPVVCRFIFTCTHLIIHLSIQSMGKWVWDRHLFSNETKYHK